MMLRALILGSAVILAAQAEARPSRNSESSPNQQQHRRPRTPADPAAIIAAEIAFNRLAQEKGQWTAFRTTAAPEAELFVPQRVKAALWLKKRADPVVSVKWAPSAVWLSCDGSYGVTRGQWQRPGSAGDFVTLWQRQPKDGSYKWLLDMSIDTERPGDVTTNDMVTASVADCRPHASASATLSAPASANMTDTVKGASRDGTLSWSSTVWPDGARRLTVSLWKDGSFNEVLNVGSSVPPPASNPPASSSPGPKP